MRDAARQREAHRRSERRALEYRRALAENATMRGALVGITRLYDFERKRPVTTLDDAVTLARQTLARVAL